MKPNARPTWLDPVFDAPAMREADRWAIEDRGVSSLDLMDRAGTALARAAEEMASGRPVAIVCGKGNNAGDGFVAARLLTEWGHEVRLVELFEAGELSGDAAANRQRLPDGVVSQLGTALVGAGVIVDAVLGTGSSGGPHGAAAAAIAAINAAESPVLACDIASGVDASSGEVPGAAVTADRTVSFHGAKLGHLIAPGKGHTGVLEVVPIGIPEGEPSAGPSGTIRGAVLGLLPRRGPDSSKFTSGSILIVGGSRGLTGAPVLAARAASRTGAGYATVAVPASLEPILEAKLTEQMTRGVPDDADPGCFGPEAADAVLEAAERADVVLLGPGLGRGLGVGDLVRRLVTALEAPIVLDADGLNALEGDSAIIAGRKAVTILTPHAGELGRLLGVDSGEVSARRLASARTAAERAGAFVVLKGDDTLVAGADGALAIANLPSPALATAGTGDVLAGAIAALLARGAEPLVACAAAVHAHARAGRIAATRIGGAESVIASDVIEALPAALAGERPS